MSAKRPSSQFTGTLEERLNKLRGLLEYLPPELPAPAKAEDSRYYAGSSDAHRRPSELQAFVEKTFSSADDEPMTIAERGAGLLDLVRQIQKCVTTWNSLEWVDKIVAAVYQTCLDGQVQTPTWDKVPPKRPRGRPVGTSSLPQAQATLSAPPPASQKRAVPPEPSPASAKEIKVKKRKKGQNTTTQAAAPETSASAVNGASLSQPERLPSPPLALDSVDRYHYTERAPSKRFWDPQGTVVIQVEKTLYCLNAARLSQSSGYFRNNISEEATPDQDTVDGHPVYLVEQVSTDDFETLLTMLDDATQFVLEPQPFSVLASILRASTTLKFTKIRLWATRELENTWSSADISTFTPEPLPGAVEALELARLYDIPAIIKRARYEVSRVQTQQWFVMASAVTGDRKSDSQAQLSVQEVILLGAARETYVAHWTSNAATPPTELTKDCCPSTLEKLAGWNTLIHDSGFYQQWLYDPVYGLRVLSELPWDSLDYCNRCSREMKETWQREARKIWGDLDAVIGPESHVDLFNSPQSQHSLMLEPDSLFGSPSLLLGGLGVTPCPESDEELSASSTNESHHSQAFVPSSLLGGTETSQARDTGPDSTGKQGVYSDSRGLLKRRVHVERSLLDDGFTANGLLGEPGPSLMSKESDTQTSSSSFPPVSESESQSQEDELPSLSDIIRPYITSRDPSGGLERSPLSTGASQRGSIRATTLSGKAVFLRRKPRKAASSISPTTHRSFDVNRLLSVPVHRLMDSLAAATAARMTIAENNLPHITASQNEGQKSDLLVDVYRPKRFIDLVGDDRVHREVMAWVKEWDFCVFGNRKGKKRPRDEENTDPYRRPNEKILLISGPPGLGKTTLATVVAQHAGYKVFDVNASDTRTAQTVDDRIRPAVESGSAVGSTKPNLIIIDEIDGSTGGTDNSAGFIQRLIQLTLDKPKKKGRKGGAKESCPLLRPIICICNDLYASSLTKLRPHARIIRFNRPNDIHLVRRLRTICECEGLKAESRALTTLVGLAQGDMRGCLNTLQMLQARSEEITESIVRKATSGMKEADASQTSVLNSIFLPVSKKRVKDLGMTEEEEARYVTRLSKEVDASGAMDKIAIGCFEHYTSLRKHDANFSRYLKANEWLSSYDLMAGEMRSEREYSMLQYLSYMLVPFHPLFCERSSQRVERPKADWENYTRTKLNEEIYKSLGKSMQTAGTRQGGAYRHFCSDEIMQLEFAPYINRIISPPLRPVNSQVVRPEERALLTRLVDIMTSLELRFIQERAEDGQLVYRLDPPIDVFVTYDGKRAADIAVSRYGVRHLVASEIDAKLSNLKVDAVEKPARKKHDFFGSRTKGPTDDNDDGSIGGEGKLLRSASATATITNKRARLDNTLAEKVPTDFFGRPIVQSSKRDASKPVSKKVAEKKRSPGVLYRFNEGNSAAVRKPVKVASFC